MAADTVFLLENHELEPLNKTRFPVAEARAKNSTFPKGEATDKFYLGQVFQLCIAKPILSTRPSAYIYRRTSRSEDRTKRDTLSRNCPALANKLNTGLLV